MIVKRNMLCVKNKDNLDLGKKLLYNPYKNILENMVELCLKVEKKEFDPVAQIYHGLASVPNEIKYYYESLLGVTSYYQHSSGGEAKYLEKKLSSISRTSTVGVELKEIPFWLTHSEIFWKRGIHTSQALTSQDKSILRKTKWNWIGEELDNSTIDLVNFLKNKQKIVFCESKTSTQTGGAAGRREIWSKKFSVIMKHFKSEKNLFTDATGKQYTLSQMFQKFGFSSLEMFIGILFNVDGTPATLKGDVFASSNREVFKELKGIVAKSTSFDLIELDEKNFSCTIKTKKDKFLVKMSALYGNDVPLSLFGTPDSVNNLLLLKFDDMWIGQLIAISERCSLLKYSKNCMVIFKSLCEKDSILRTKFDKVIQSELNKRELRDILSYLKKEYRTIFSDEIIPDNRNREDYLADIIQVLASAES